MMKIRLNIFLFGTVALILLAIGQMRMVHAHAGHGIIDPAGNVPTFTAVAQVTCFNDGNGAPAYLVANIKDLWGPLEGMFVTLALFKGGQAISTTDTGPGDNNPSQFVALLGGAGSYYLIVNKTRPGQRFIDIECHCMSDNNVHVGTDFELVHFR